MIGKPQWFARRKYGGWGLYPKTWQGWVYSLIIVAITAAIASNPIDNMTVKMSVLIIWAVILLIEIGSIMVKINDEREKLHEAIAERNALWVIIIVLVIGVGYQVASSSVKNDISAVDPFLIAAIVIGLIVKAISNLWMDKRN